MRRYILAGTVILCFASCFICPSSLMPFHLSKCAESTLIGVFSLQLETFIHVASPSPPAPRPHRASPAPVCQVPPASSFPISPPAPPALPLPPAPALPYAKKKLSLLGPRLPVVEVAEYQSSPPHHHTISHNISPPHHPHHSPASQGSHCFAEPQFVVESLPMPGLTTPKPTQELFPIASPPPQPRHQTQPSGSHGAITET